MARGGARVNEQPDFSTTPRPRRPAGKSVIALGVGLLALSVAIHAAWTARQEVNAARDRLAGVRSEIATLEARARAFGARSAGGQPLSRATGAFEAPPERIVATLGRALPDDARVERLTIVYGDQISLEMQIVARDPGAWDRTLERLVETPSLEELSPGPERREGEIRTTIRGQWAGGAR
jgi:hypothetical protein